MFQELIDRRLDIECQHVCQLTASFIGEVLVVNEKRVGEVAAPNVVGPGRGHVATFPSASWHAAICSLSSGLAMPLRMARSVVQRSLPRSWLGAAPIQATAYPTWLVELCRFHERRHTAV